MIKGGGSKTAKKGWDVKFDILLHEDNVIENISRGKLIVLAPGEDEESFMRASQAEELACIENEEEEKKRKEKLANAKITKRICGVGQGDFEILKKIDEIWGSSRGIY